MLAVLLWGLAPRPPLLPCRGFAFLSLPRFIIQALPNPIMKPRVGNACFSQCPTGWKMMLCPLVRVSETQGGAAEMNVFCEPLSPLSALLIPTSLVDA
jgi:hypothetical protein